jgi:SOS response regulatory protein OraA/RecX
MALKQAKKRPELYTKEELLYMAVQLRRAKIALKAKQQRRRQEKGFSNDTSESSINHSRSGEDDGVCSEGIESSEPGES